MFNRVHRRLYLCLGLCLCLTACASDDEGAGGDAGDEGDAGRDPRGREELGTDGGGDASATPDASPNDDQGTPAPDLPVTACGGPDEACCTDATPCNGGLECIGAVCRAVASQCPATPACLEPAVGAAGVPVVMRGGDPPVLQGGTVTSGALELDQIEVYADYTFSSLVESVNVTSNGGTAGGLEFQAADWGFSAELDLFIDITAIGMDFGQPFQQVLGAGGCYTVEDNFLASDLSECGASWPEGAEPPDSLEFETTAGGMRFLLILTREALLASVPPENQFAAELAIEGDLPVLFTFSRP